MSAPIIPPPISDTGANVYPRTLQRWLDVNRATKLDRTSTYINIPAFTQGANTWNGYSDIVIAFNVESPNNLSFSSYIAPTSPNFALCVSYRVGGTVTRYMLWDATGSNLNQTIPQYTGQLILKNFRFEVWNTSQGAASMGSSFQLYTSVLGKMDYRWASDSSLVSTDSPCVVFSSNLNLPFTFPSNSISTTN